MNGGRRTPSGSDSRSGRHADRPWASRSGGSGAGLGINYSDNHYSEAGAEIVATPAEVYQADIILKILPPLTAEVMMMKPRTTLFSTVQFNTFSHEAFELMMAKRITAVAYELLADDKQRCPVLNVISEIEGTASITIASELLSNTQGGKGILLGAYRAFHRPRS